MGRQNIHIETEKKIFFTLFLVRARARARARVCVCVCVCVCMSASNYRGQKIVPDSLQLELLVIASCLLCVLGTDF